MRPGRLPAQPDALAHTDSYSDAGSASRMASVRPTVIAAASSYEIACVAAVIGLVMAVAVAAGW